MKGTLILKKSVRVEAVGYDHQSDDPRRGEAGVVRKGDVRNRFIAPAAAAKANEGLFDHVDEIEPAAQDNDLAGKLIGVCKQPVAGSPVPAMLCWLYFGKSFERMVEHCEELRRSPDLGYFQKITMSATIQLLITRSIKLGLRTRLSTSRLG